MHGVGYTVSLGLWCGILSSLGSRELLVAILGATTPQLSLVSQEMLFELDTTFPLGPIANHCMSFLAADC